MTRVIVDAGPLVALLNRRDRYHAWARAVFDTIQPPVFTCEAVVAEVSFLVRQTSGGPEAVLELLSSGALRIDFNLSAEASAVRTLMLKFQSVPMSLADACLVRMTELVPKSIVVTLDSGFRVYRRSRRLVVPTIMPEVATG